MILIDLECPKCGAIIEELVEDGISVECPECSTEMQRVWNGQAPKLPTTIVVSYPGCKRQKAGHVHTHGDRPATKIQSGYGGCIGPKDL